MCHLQLHRKVVAAEEASGWVHLETCYFFFVAPVLPKSSLTPITTDPLLLQQVTV